MMEKVKVINTNNIKLEIKNIPWEEGMDKMLKEHKQTAQKYTINNDEEYYENLRSFEQLKEITVEDEEEMWKQIEKNYLESSQ